MRFLTATDIKSRASVQGTPVGHSYPRPSLCSSVPLALACVNDLECQVPSRGWGPTLASPGVGVRALRVRESSVCGVVRVKCLLVCLLARLAFGFLFVCLCLFVFSSVWLGSRVG